MLAIWFAVPAAYAADAVFVAPRANPTEGVGQSKVWFAHEAWWAWLPFGDFGGKIWKRDAQGDWAPQDQLDRQLMLMPGKADVLAFGDTVVAALVERNTVGVQGLAWNEGSGGYEVFTMPLLWEEDSLVETATIARDPADGSYWIAYPLDGPAGRRVVARHLPAALTYRMTPPLVLADSLAAGENCAIAAMQDSLAVIWSDHDMDAFFLRRHAAGAAEGDWEPALRVEGGDPLASSQFSLCIPPPGTRSRLLLAAVSLQDQAQPALHLQVLRDDSSWNGTPFAAPTGPERPDSPVACWVYGRPLVLYTLYGELTPAGTTNRIMLQTFSPRDFQPAGDPLEVVSPMLGVDHVTGPKHVGFNQPCLLLASDDQGLVIEAVIELAKSEN